MSGRESTTDETIPQSPRDGVHNSPESQRRKSGSPLVDADNPNLYHRGMAFLELRNMKLEKTRESRLRDEEKELTFKPQIKKLKEPLERPKNYYKYNEEWKGKIEKNIEAKRHEKSKELENEMQKKVGLSKKSRHIIEKNLRQGKYKSLTKEWSEIVEKYHQKRSQNVHDHHSFAPKINKQSAKMRRQGNIFNRLHKQAKHSTERLKDVYRKKKEQELIDSQTGQRYFKPIINENRRFSRALEHSMPVHEELINRGVETRRKREAQYKSVPVDVTFSPILNDNSRKIAESMTRKPLYTPPSQDNQNENASFQLEKFLQQRLEQDKIRKDRFNYLKKLKNDDLSESIDEPEESNPELISEQSFHMEKTNDEADVTIEENDKSAVSDEVQSFHFDESSLEEDIDVNNYGTDSVDDYVSHLVQETWENVQSNGRNKDASPFKPSPSIPKSSMTYLSHSLDDDFGLGSIETTINSALSEWEHMINST